MGLLRGLRGPGELRKPGECMGERRPFTGGELLIRKAGEDFSTEELLIRKDEVVFSTGELLTW